MLRTSPVIRYFDLQGYKAHLLQQFKELHAPHSLWLHEDLHRAMRSAEKQWKKFYGLDNKYDGKGNLRAS